MSEAKSKLSKVARLRKRLSESLGRLASKWHLVYFTNFLPSLMRSMNAMVIRGMGVVVNLVVKIRNEKNFTK